MSRTDAHAPHWATVEWYLPEHRDCPSAIYSWRSPASREHDCDLPDRPVRRRPVLSLWRAGRTTGCYWRPDWTGVSPWPRPPRWYVEHVWHNPERRRVRDTLRTAAAEYRATGDVDTEPEARQGRNSARWQWA